jgi:hypothetical protein
MKTAIDIPEHLVREAMRLTNINTGTGSIKQALANLIRCEKVKSIKSYYGKINLAIDLERLRNR